MQIKVITLNIEHGQRLDEIVDFLKSEDPHVVNIQEVYNGQSESLPKGYRAYSLIKNGMRNLKWGNFAATFDDLLEIGKIPRGNAILSSFEITKNDVTFYDVPFGEIANERGLDNWIQVPRNLQHVRLNIEGQIVDVFNTQGIWGNDGEDNERRLNMGKIIIDQIQSLPNVILAGDFNLRPQTKTILNIENHLKNVFKNELKTTFNMRQKDNPGYATAVVDMIFVSPNIEIVDHYCPDVDISDHLPLVAILEI